MFFRIVCESTHQSTTSSSSRGGAGGRNYPWPLCNHCPFHSRMVAETGVVTRAGERSSGLTLGSPARTNLFCPRPLRPFHSLEVPAGRRIAEEKPTAFSVLVRSAKIGQLPRHNSRDLSRCWLMHDRDHPTHPEPVVEHAKLGCPEGCHERHGHATSLT